MGGRNKVAVEIKLPFSCEVWTLLSKSEYVVR